MAWLIYFIFYKNGVCKHNGKVLLRLLAVVVSGINVSGANVDAIEDVSQVKVD